MFSAFIVIEQTIFHLLYSRFAAKKVSFKDDSPIFLFTYAIKKNLVLFIPFLVFPQLLLLIVLNSVVSVCLD